MSTSIRHIKAGEGETLWFAGAHQTVKHPGAWSSGGFSLVEVTVPRGRATPLHRDPSDETFYLLEGEICSTPTAPTTQLTPATPSPSQRA